MIVDPEIAAALAKAAEEATAEDRPRTLRCSAEAAHMLEALKAHNRPLFEQAAPRILLVADSQARPPRKVGEAKTADPLWTASDLAGLLAELDPGHAGGHLKWLRRRMRRGQHNPRPCQLTLRPPKRAGEEPA